MTLNQALNWANQELKKTGLPRHTSTLGRGVPRNDNIILDAEILLSFVLKKDKAFLYSYPEKSIMDQQLTKYKKYINFRSKGKPVAYLTEHKQFYGLDFGINKNVLIPRPETELIVEEVIKQLTTNKQQPTIIIDIGTGSGCIPISIFKKLPNSYKLRTKFVATDISPKALSVARRNARLHKLDKKIKFIQGSLLEPIIKLINNGKIEQLSNIILTANLPYLPYKIYRQNYTQLKYEPKSALLAKNNGLEYYEKLLKQLKKFKIYRPAGDPPSPNNKINNYPWGDNLKFIIYLEILPFQAKPLTQLVHNFLPLAKITTRKDLTGQKRIFIVKLINKNHPS
jgi:release factor glutamine methyltransferase